MTITEMQNSSQVWLTPQDIAPVLECDPNVIRRQAQEDPSKLCFPVVVLCSRVKIHRKGFLKFLGEEKPPACGNMERSAHSKGKKQDFHRHSTGHGWPMGKHI